ncbi:MAG: ester cyclase [Bacteroidia bacterium]|nr:ester cyclase [Bacteroidia bacterium]NND25577.1 hypothetical protein [Flavobacteriaceae bacterium]MBT8278724.1 ester cyclase [Bacteroidia bacterium]NNK60525.1 hypothetical protein [Flavobacteriaceae bacterium]NNL31999.1 hypothetical protein [Flavobacteriaceae bacterium]
MKKILILVLVVLTFAACQKQEQRYFAESAEINSLKAGITAFETADWETWKSHFADTAKIYANSKEGISVSQRLADLQAMTSAFKSYGFDHKDEYIEMVLDKDDKTFVYYWAQFNGTMVNNKELSIPVHLAVNFVDGKIAAEYIYFDATEMNNGMAALAAENAAAEADEPE